MKYINNKYVYFILIFIALFLFGFIIFQLVFFRIFTLWSENPLFGLSAMAVCFIAIPTLGAYYITSKRYPVQLTEEDRKSASRRRKITLGLILTIVLIIFLKGFTEIKPVPYKYQPITDQEFVKPLEIKVIKNIESYEYYLKENEKNGVSLYRKEGSNRKDDRFLYDLPFIEAKSVRDFWFYGPKNIIYVVTNPQDRFEQIIRILLNSQEEEQVKVLKTVSMGFYSSADRILDFFQESQTLLLENSGGDGCGGRGTIWFLNESTSQTLQEYGAGCVLEKPRFAGYDGKFLYFAFLKSGESKTPGDLGIAGLKELFKIDPRTKERLVLPVSNLPEDIYDVRLSDDKNNIIITTATSKRFALSLDNLLIKEASSSANN